MSNVEEIYLQPKNHPGITLHMSYGQCACFMCRDMRVTTEQRDSMLQMLAQDLVRKSPQKADAWLGDWVMRHGQVALSMLQDHIRRERRHANR